MDLEILFWLLFILAPVLSRLLKGKKSSPNKRPKPAPKTRRSREVGAEPPKSRSNREREERQPSSRPEPARALSPFEEALQEIQEALAEAREERQAQPAPTPPAPPQPEEPQSSERSVLFKPQPSEPKIPGTPTPATLAQPPSEIESSFYDDAFESNAPYEEAFHEEVHTHVPPSEIEPGRRREKIGRSKWEKAFVMHEVLNRPRSMKRWRPRLPGED